MDDATRTTLIRTGWDIHAAVEDSYRHHPATRGGDDNAPWLEKQRLLLADMAVHLLQTALRPGSLEYDALRNNLHAILTISDQFLPHAALKEARAKLYLDDPATQ